MAVGGGFIDRGRNVDVPLDAGFLRSLNSFDAPVGGIRLDLPVGIDTLGVEVSVVRHLEHCHWREVVTLAIYHGGEEVDSDHGTCHRRTKHRMPLGDSFLRLENETDGCFHRRSVVARGG